MDNSSQEAATSAFSDASVVFTGEVQADKLPKESIEVSLDSSLDTGWPADLNPIIMTFGPGQSAQNFTVNVTVPHSAPAGLVAILHVTAKWTGPVTVLAEGNASVTVKAYYRMNLHMDSFLEIPPGGHASLNIRVENIGNSWVSYRISIVNERLLTAKGLTIDYGPKTLDVPQGASGTSRINISIPQEWTLDKVGTDDIYVKVSFDNDTGAQNLTFILRLFEHGPDPLTLQVLYGGIATIILAAAVVTAFIMLRRRRRRKKKE